MPEHGDEGRMDAIAATGSMRLVFSGRGLDDGFLDFLSDRARRFGLKGHARLTSPEEVVALLEGPLPLIDMLEVACLLGPVTCIVDTVETILLNEQDLQGDFAAPA